MSDSPVVRWSKPKSTDGLSVVFAASTTGYLPPQNEIPDEFHRYPGTVWNRLVTRWFFSGLAAPLRFKPEIDAQAAMRHLNICMRSWEPKHEHKEAGVAYLLSLWCPPEAADTPASELKPS